MSLALLAPGKVDLSTFLNERHGAACDQCHAKTQRPCAVAADMHGMCRSCTLCSPLQLSKARHKASSANHKHSVTPSQKIPRDRRMRARAHQGSRHEGGPPGHPCSTRGRSRPAHARSRLSSAAPASASQPATCSTRGRTSPSTGACDTVSRITLPTPSTMATLVIGSLGCGGRAREQRQPRSHVERNHRTTSRPLLPARPDVGSDAPIGGLIEKCDEASFQRNVDVSRG